ncbi:MAG: NOB1 family endonuclease [Methermicoccaceae archaeon]
MDEMYVCDTSVFLCGHHQRIPMDRAITTPDVVSEVKSTVGRCVLEVALSHGLRVERAKKEVVGHIRRRAEHLGDLPMLSAADLTVVAKAVEVGGTVVSDDYDVQNVCAKLKIPYLPVVQEGINGCRRWVYVCPACKRRFEAGRDCPVCGTTLVVRRS